MSRAALLLMAAGIAACSALSACRRMCGDEHDDWRDAGTAAGRGGEEPAPSGGMGGEPTSMGVQSAGSGGLALAGRSGSAGGEEDAGVDDDAGPPDTGVSSVIVCPTRWRMLDAIEVGLPIDDLAYDATTQRFVYVTQRGAHGWKPGTPAIDYDASGPWRSIAVDPSGTVFFIGASPNDAPNYNELWIVDPAGTSGRRFASLALASDRRALRADGASSLWWIQESSIDAGRVVLFDRETRQVKATSGQFSGLMSLRDIVLTADGEIWYASNTAPPVVSHAARTDLPMSMMGEPVTLPIGPTQKSILPADVAADANIIGLAASEVFGVPSRVWALVRVGQAAGVAVYAARSDDQGKALRLSGLAPAAIATLPGCDVVVAQTDQDETPKLTRVGADVQVDLMPKLTDSPTHMVFAYPSTSLTGSTQARPPLGAAAPTKTTFIGALAIGTAVWEIALEP